MASILTSLNLDRLTALEPADHAAVMTQLSDVLAALPPDAESNKDAALRELLTVFLAGYELGSS